MTNTLTARDGIGRRLLASRALAGMDQQQIADAIGVSRTTVSGWERGKFEPTFSTMVKLARLTGQPLEWFAEAVEPGDVRPERLELPTFCMGASEWTVADDVSLMLFAASMVGGPDAHRANAISL